MWKKEHRRLDCWRASCCFFSFAAKVLEVPQEVMLPTNGPSAPVDRFLPFGGVQQLVALALFATPMLLQSSWSRSPCDLKLSSPAAEWRRTQLLYVHSRGKNIGEEDQYSAESAYSSVGRASGKVRTTDQHVVRPKNWDYLRKSAFSWLLSQRWVKKSPKFYITRLPLLPWLWWPTRPPFGGTPMWCRPRPSTPASPPWPPKVTRIQCMPWAGWTPTMLPTTPTIISCLIPMGPHPRGLTR